MSPFPLLLAAVPATSPALAKDTRLSYDTLPSAAEGRDMAMGIYTPPGWDGTTPLPLVVFLHGGGGSETAWDDHPISHRTLDRWIAEGRLPPFVMVTPNGERGFWRNWYDGSHNYADWVLDEVIPEMYARYPLVAPEAGGMHLMGISMGGAGSTYLMLDHLDRFASAAVFSAPLFTAEQANGFLERGGLPFMEAFGQVFGPPDIDRVTRDNVYTRINDAQDLQGTRLLIGAGTVDMFGVLKSTRALHETFAERGVPHDYLVYKGGHRWQDWSKVYPVALCLNLAGDACELPKSAFYKLERVTADQAVATTAP